MNLVSAVASRLLLPDPEKRAGGGTRGPGSAAGEFGLAHIVLGAPDHQAMSRTGPLTLLSLPASLAAPVARSTE